MAIFADGFESGVMNNPPWTSSNIGSGCSWAVETNNPYLGAYNAKMVLASSSWCYQRSIWGPGQTWTAAHLAFYFKATALPGATNGNYFKLGQIYNATGTHAVVSWQRDAGVVKWALEYLKNGADTTIRSTVNPVANQWYCVEIYYTVHATAALVGLYVDGSLLLADSGFDGDNYGNIDRFILGSAGSANSPVTVYYDRVAADTSYIGPEAYTLNGNPGALAIAGTNANLLRSALLSSNPGSVSLTGANANLLRSTLLTGGSGTLAISGAEAGLLKSSLLTGNPGEVILSGQQAQLLRSALLSGTPGSMIITGASAALLKSSLLSLNPGAVVITGTEAALIFTSGSTVYTLNCLSGQINIAGASADMLRSMVLVCNPASVILDGKVVALTYSGETFTPSPERTLIMATEDRVVLVPLQSRTIRME